MIVQIVYILILFTTGDVLINSHIIMYINLVILLLIIFLINLLIAQFICILVAHLHSNSYASLDSGILYIAKPDSKFVELPASPSSGEEAPENPTSEVVDSGTEGIDSTQDTKELTDTSSSEVEAQSTKQFSILGAVSVDYSKIDTGYIIILCNNSPMLSINIHWILASMTRSSRRRLAKWLDGKELSGFPIGTSDNSIPSSPSSSADTLSTSDSPAAEKSKPEISDSKILMVKKLSRILNIDLSPGSVSNSLADSLRQLLKSGSVKFAIKNSLLNPQHTHPDSFKVVEFVVLLEMAKKNLTSKRSAKKSQKSPKNRPGKSKAGN